MKKTKKRKKAVKVKKKIVKSRKKSKKKAVKKRLLEKKATKKKVRRKKKVALKRKKKKRQRRKKISMEDIYVILNKVQIGKKKITFASSIDDAPTIENTIRDVELRYNKIEMKTQVVFTIYPGENDYEEEDIMILEIMDDEIPEIGQIFG